MNKVYLLAGAAVLALATAAPSMAAPIDHSQANGVGALMGVSIGVVRMIEIASVQDLDFGVLITTSNATDPVTVTLPTTSDATGEPKAAVTGNSEGVWSYTYGDPSMSHAQRGKICVNNPNGAMTDLALTAADDHVVDMDTTYGITVRLSVGEAFSEGTGAQTKTCWYVGGTASVPANVAPGRYTGVELMQVVYGDTAAIGADPYAAANAGD